MSAFNYFKECFTTKFADFKGRARRSEFWYFTLFTLLASIVVGILDGLLASLIGMPILTIVFMLALIIPSIAVTIRRLHDTDRSGWWILVGLVPILGSIALLVFYVQDSKPGANAWGPNPKGIGSDEPIEHLITDEV